MTQYSKYSPFGGGGSGVSGPGSSTDNAVVRWDGTAGDTVQNSSVIISDAGVITGATGLTSSGTINFSGLTASTVPYSDGSKNLVSSAVTPTELGYVSGVTSAIQTQLNATQPLDTDLTALAGLSTTGLIARTGSGLASTRTVTAGNGITITDGDGVSGNPTVAITSSWLSQKGTQNTWVGNTTNAVVSPTGTRNVMVGYGAGAALNAGNSNSLVGYNAGVGLSDGTSNVALGYECLRTNVSGSSNVAVGLEAGYSTTSSNGVFLGRAAGYNTTGSNNAFVGRESGVSNTTGQANTAIGYLSYATNDTGSSNTALGADTAMTSGVSASIALGRGATATTSNTMVIGAASYSITDLFIGKGVTTASPSTITLNATGGSGTNVAGAALVLAGGRGTGSGVGGEVQFSTAPAGGSGSALNSLVTRAAIGEDGGFELVEQTAPGTPASGRVTLYAKSDKSLYMKGSTGVETPLGYLVESKSGDFTAASGYIYLVSSAAARAITLPAAASGAIFKVKDSTGSCNTNNFTITRAGSESIEGVAANRTLSAAWGSWTFVSDGTNWFIL